MSRPKVNDRQSSSPVGRWNREVRSQTGQFKGGNYYFIDHEYLDVDAAAERLHEAMRERPDAGVRAWLDVALNGWPEESHAVSSTARTGDGQ